jgi:hypothetical protein
MFSTPLVFSWSEEFTREVRSALPDAPVVPDRATRPAPTRRTRIAAANVLQRAADAVAPAECSPAR